MQWGVFIPIAAIVVGPLGWIATTWIRARHGYPIEHSDGKLLHREDPQLREENRMLRDQVAHLEQRLRVLERIATDPATRTIAEIEALR